MKDTIIKKGLIRFVLIFFLLFTGLTFILYLDGGGQETPEEYDATIITTGDIQQETGQTLTGEVQLELDADRQE